MFGSIAAGVKADPRAGMPVRLQEGGVERASSDGGRARTIEDAGAAGGHGPMPGEAPGSGAPSRIVQQRVREVVVNTPQGPVVLRRTVTDEVRGVE